MKLANSVASPASQLHRFCPGWSARELEVGDGAAAVVAREGSELRLQEFIEPLGLPMNRVLLQRRLRAGNDGGEIGGAGMTV